MWFVHPGILAAAAILMTLPVIIHLINRRRYRREAWAATMFLERAHQRSRRRIRMDHWLLLVLRTLVLAILGVTLARPYLTSSASAWSGARSAVDRVLILDDSLSMHARHVDGTTSFGSARSAALKVLSAMQPGDGATVLTASTPVRAHSDRPVHDASALIAQIESLECGWGQTDLAAAMTKAGELLSHGRAAPGGREIYIITDMTLASMPTEPISSRSGIGADRIVLVDVGPSQRENLSIAALHADASIIGTRLPLRVRVDVSNHGDDAVESADVQIVVDGRIERTLSAGPLAPRSTMTVSADVSFENAGPHVMTAVLAGATNQDVLPADDSRYQAIDVPERLAVLLVEGSPDAAISDRSLFYYRVALETLSHGDGDGFVHARTITPSELESELLSEHRVVVLGDVQELSETSWRRLRRFVRAGGGLVMLLGEQADAEHYNRFAFNTHAGMRVPVEESVADTEASDAIDDRLPLANIQLGDTVRSDDAAAGIMFKAWSPDHPLSSDFAGRDDGGLTQAVVRLYRRLLSAGGDAAAGRNVILSFSNDEPALIGEAYGAGRVFVVATGLNMAQSTLPSKPDFVPFVFAITGRAAGDERSRLNVEVGESFVSMMHVGLSDSTRMVVAPDGSTRPVQVEPLRDMLATVFRETRDPGVYRMRDSESHELFTVNVRGGESDLRRVDDRAVRAAFGSDTVVVDDVSAALEPSARHFAEFAGISMYMLFALLLMETWAAASGRAR